VQQESRCNKIPSATGPQLQQHLVETCVRRLLDVITSLSPEYHIFLNQTTGERSTACLVLRSKAVQHLRELAAAPCSMVQNSVQNTLMVAFTSLRKCIKNPDGDDAGAFQAYNDPNCATLHTLSAQLNTLVCKDESEHATNASESSETSDGGDGSSNESLYSSDESLHSLTSYQSDHPSNGSGHSSNESAPSPHGFDHSESFPQSATFLPALAPILAVGGAMDALFLRGSLCEDAKYAGTLLRNDVMDAFMGACESVLAADWKRYCMLGDMIRARMIKALWELLAPEVCTCKMIEPSFVLLFEAVAYSRQCFCVLKKSLFAYRLVNERFVCHRMHCEFIYPSAIYTAYVCSVCMNLVKHA
jgi:hypothetical protein